MRALVLGSLTCLIALPSAVLAMPEPQPLASLASAIYSAADADGDGLVTRTELDAALVSFSNRTQPDFERDWATMLRVAGVDERADRIDFPAAVRGALGLYGRADVDGDDRVTEAEKLALVATLPEDDRDAALELMASADADMDGVVDPTELANVRQEVENYLAAQAVDPDAVPADGVVLKTDTLARFMERAEALKADTLLRFELVAANGGSAQVSLLRSDADRVAEAVAPDAR